MVGDKEGEFVVGAEVGDNVGLLVGDSVGKFAVGDKVVVGAEGFVPDSVGAEDGDNVGLLVGDSAGEFVVGDKGAEGFGDDVGADVGDKVEILPWIPPLKLESFDSFAAIESLFDFPK